MSDCDLTLDIGDVSGPGRVGEILIRPLSAGDNGTYWQSDHAGRIPLKYNDPAHASSDPAYSPTYTILGVGKWEPVKQGAYYEFTIVRVNTTDVNEKFTAQIPGTATANFSDLVTVPAPLPSPTALIDAAVNVVVTDTDSASRATLDSLYAGAIAYTENRTGDVTLSQSAGATIHGTTLVVPPTDKDVWLYWGLDTALWVAGEGVIFSLMYDFTAGGATIVGKCTPEKYEAAAVASINGPTHEGRCRIGPSATARVYALLLQHYSATGSSIQAYAVNGNTNYTKTYVAAVA